MKTILKTPANCESATPPAAAASCRASHIGKATILFFVLGLVAIGMGCSSLDRDLQVEIEAMAHTIDTQLDPDLPASFRDAAKRQARETVKYAESNDPLLRRNVTEMLDTIRHDLDPGLEPYIIAEHLAHAEAVKEWIDSGDRPAYFNPPDTESGNTGITGGLNNNSP